MYRLHILFKKVALSLHDGLHLAWKAAQVLATGLVHGGKVLLNGADQGGLGSVGTLIHMCLQVAPHKIVQWIKIRTAGTPAVLREQIVAVVHEPLLSLYKQLMYSETSVYNLETIFKTVFELLHLKICPDFIYKSCIWIL
jgi:hypothetical protein